MRAYIKLCYSIVLTFSVKAELLMNTQCAPSRKFCSELIQLPLKTSLQIPIKLCHYKYTIHKYWKAGLLCVKYMTDPLPPFPLKRSNFRCCGHCRLLHFFSHDWTDTKVMHRIALKEPANAVVWSQTFGMRHRTIKLGREGEREREKAARKVRDF